MEVCIVRKGDVMHMMEEAKFDVVVKEIEATAEEGKSKATSGDE
jgi:hypothetical protein